MKWTTISLLEFLSICMTISLAAGQGREGAPPSLSGAAHADPSPIASSTVSIIYENHISILKKVSFSQNTRYQ